MPLTDEENELIEALREISRLRTVLIMVKYMADLDDKDSLEIILKMVNEVLGTE